MMDKEQRYLQATITTLKCRIKGLEEAQQRQSVIIQAQNKQLARESIQKILKGEK